MNGRVFDTNIGRFIQADIVNDSGIQGLNPYSYVLNNPFSLTDPSGYLSFGDVLRLAVSLTITYFTAGLGASTALSWLGFAESLTSTFWLAVAGGFASGAVMTGSLKGALFGALSAGLFFNIGSYFGNAKWAHVAGNLKKGLTTIARVAKVVAHGVAGGVMNVLQGGKFGHGFISAGINEAVSPITADIDSQGGQIVASAIVGGTVSELTGGKFANGAITAAFSTAYNHQVSKRARRYGYGTNQPERITSCREDNSCITLEEASAGVADDAKGVVGVFVVAPAVTAGGFVLAVEAAPLVAIAGRSRSAKYILCAGLSLCSYNNATGYFSPSNRHPAKMIRNAQIFRDSYKYLGDKITSVISRVVPVSAAPLNDGGGVKSNHYIMENNMPREEILRANDLHQKENDNGL